MKFSICALSSGSSGNSNYIQTGCTSLLIDAGKSGSFIQEALVSISASPHALDGILVTHEHSDHIQSIGILSRRFDIPLYLNEKTWNAVKSKVGKVAERNIRIFENGSTFEINDIQVTSFSIPHDAVDPVGFCLSNGSKKIGFATDLGHMNQEILDQIKDSDLVFLESNHDIKMLEEGPYPPYLKQRVRSKQGHLSNIACGEAIVELAKHKASAFMLAHLSKTNNTPSLAYKSVVEVLNSYGVSEGKDVQIKVTRRNQPSGLLEL